MDRCIYCGSTDIIYDPSRGYTVCSSCGSIIDVIYDSDSVLYSRIGNPGELLRARQEHGYGAEKSSRAGVAMIINAGRAYKIYRNIVGGKKLKRGVFVSSEALQDLMAGRKPSRVFEHASNKVVTEFLEKSPVLKKVIDIMKEYPSIYSRTARGRAATAYIAAKMVIRDPISLSTLSRFFNISKVHLRRIRSALEESREFLSRISYIEDLSREMVEADMYIKKYLGL